MNNDGNLSLMGLYGGYFNTKCASFSIALQEQKLHSLVSLEIGIVIHHLVSIAILWSKSVVGSDDLALWWSWWLP